MVTQEGNQALHAYAAGSDGMGQAILDLFPRDAVDYSVSWHQLEGDAGMLLRGGYLFRTQGDKVSVAMMEKDENGILKLGRTLGEGDKADGMAYFRATLHGTKLYFDGSTDGKQWQNMISVEDATFASGETRLCWEASMTVDDRYGRHQHDLWGDKCGHPQFGYQRNGFVGGREPLHGRPGF